MPVKMEIYVSEQCIYFVAADWIVIADYLHTFIEMVTQKWIAKCFSVACKRTIPGSLPIGQNYKFYYYSKKYSKL